MDIYCVWPCAWAVGTIVDMPDVPVFIQSHGEAGRPSRKNTIGIDSQCDRSHMNASDWCNLGHVPVYHCRGGWEIEFWLIPWGGMDFKRKILSKHRQSLQGIHEKVAMKHHRNLRCGCFQGFPKGTQGQRRRTTASISHTPL